MISLNIDGEWITLDTLNGKYRLDDLFKEAGSPEGFEPIVFARKHGPHPSNSIQITSKYVWSTQGRVYAYAAFLSDEFAEIMRKSIADKDIILARTIATGVIHK